MKALTEQGKHEYCKAAVALETEARELYLRMGEMFSHIRTESLYEPFWASWHEYTMEFKDLSGSAISKMISIYEVFILKFGYKPAALAKVGGWTKLYEITLHAKTKVQAERWLEKASSMPRTDLAKELIEAKTGIEMRNCKHEDTFIIEICRGCGDKWPHACST